MHAQQSDSQPDLETISGRELERALALRDLADPAQGPHAMQRLVADVVDALEGLWGLRPTLERGPAVVLVADNYGALDYPEEAATRDARYTRYLGQGRMLRSHTSARVPALLRRLAAAEAREVAWAIPGLCWRRDVVDRYHVGAPHQLDLWRLRPSEDPTLERADLLAMIDAVIAAALPGARWRANDTSHPYTEGGLEVEAEVAGEWVEVLECGLAAPRVLERAGLDGRSWSGLAMGCGLDRLLMLRKGVPDIRLLRERDERVAKQMLDLEPYRAVSKLPPVRRDLSLAVPEGWDAETLGDQLRLLPEEDLEAVEELEILAETAAADLPPQAVSRIGLSAGQKNVLVRLHLRHPTRTLTDAEANAVRDAAYALLHQGSAHEWTTEERRAMVEP